MSGYPPVVWSAPERCGCADPEYADEDGRAICVECGGPAGTLPDDVTEWEIALWSQSLGIFREGRRMAALARNRNR